MADMSSSSRDKGAHQGPGGFQHPSGVKDKARDDASALAAQGKEAAAAAAEKAKEVGATFVQKAGDAASSSFEKTKEMASAAVQKVEDVASTIGHKTGAAVDTVGGGMKSLAGTIRENAPHAGVLGDTASGIASGLESGGSYLQEHNINEMAKDVTELVRRYPLEAILVGVGVGFLMGRGTRSNHGN